MILKKIFFICFIIHILSFNSFAQNPAPNEFRKMCQETYLIGSSNLNFLGLKVYQIYLWSENKSFSYDKKFAIEILYNMNFSKEDLAKRSIEEIKKTSVLTHEEENSYYQKLVTIFNDIKKGDKKIAIFDPKNGVKLFHNHIFKGEISDLKFARLFVDIWLNEKGSYPQITKRILGKSS